MLILWVWSPTNAYFSNIFALWNFTLFVSVSVWILVSRIEGCFFISSELLFFFLSTLNYRILNALNPSLIVLSQWRARIAAHCPQKMYSIHYDYSVHSHLSLVHICSLVRSLFTRTEQSIVARRLVDPPLVRFSCWADSESCHAHCTPVHH